MLHGRTNTLAIMAATLLLAGRVTAGEMNTLSKEEAADAPHRPAVAGDWASGGGFVEHYRIQVCPPDGRNDTVFEFPGITKLANGELFSVFIEETGPVPRYAAGRSARLRFAAS